jgi:hypothetical protein
MKYDCSDYGFLRWRWCSDDCDLPRFDAATFFDIVRNTSLAFTGDSLARNHTSQQTFFFLSLDNLCTRVISMINNQTSK